MIDKIYKSKKYTYLLKTLLKIKLFFSKVDYVLVFFVFLLVFSFMYSYITRQNTSSIYNQNDIPNLEIKGLVLSRFDSNIINMTIKSDSVAQYNDKEIFRNFSANRINSDNILEYLKGKEVLRMGDIYDFVDGVHYIKSPEIKFFSQKGEYNSKIETFVGKGYFLIEDTNMTTTGKDIFYDSNTDMITAKDITTTILRF